MANDACLAAPAAFVTGMYSTLAGFVEPGEALEKPCAARFWRRWAIKIATRLYRSSQPWPFPQSLMLGFRARALTGTIRIDFDEIEDARWFDRAQLRDEERRPVRLPSADSIARS